MSFYFMAAVPICTEELYKKDLHDQDNHDGVITHLEPDILDCEVKWALESIKFFGAQPSLWSNSQTRT